MNRKIQIEYGVSNPLVAQLGIVSYLNRTAPEIYSKEETKFGPMVWDGLVNDLYFVQDKILKAPQDVIPLSFQYRNAHQGEIDIFIGFHFEGELPLSLIDAMRSCAFAVMSLVNLRLNDHLMPEAPFQLRKVTADGGVVDSSVMVAVHERSELTRDETKSSLSDISHVLDEPEFGEKLRIALELYAAHFTEKQARVRFLLLVIAIESLARGTKKHPCAIALLDRWQKELRKEIDQFGPTSEEFQSLDALLRELSFRAEDSIRSQVRKLFRNLGNRDKTSSDELERKALHVYDKRSELVHDGFLPTDELVGLEGDARELLEAIFASAITAAKLSREEVSRLDP